VFDTHVHADHLSGARDLAMYKQAGLHMSELALHRGVRDAGFFTPLHDGAGLALGQADVTVLALPGHTSDMTGLLVDGHALIAGDSLFADSVARPDLEAGDAGAAEAAGVLWTTLQERILPLPGETLLLPCHYPGGRLTGPIAPTLDQVRAAVPELALPREEFVRRTLAQMPPRPANYLEIIDRNLGVEMDDDDAARLEVGANNCAVSPSWAAAS
jgi:glyoxylase-like metal-dependent hydrolase (beta-lactamase superfamily II)